MNSNRLDLDAVTDALYRKRAPEYLESGEIELFVHCAYPNHRMLDLVADNWKLLQAKGVLEEALVHAYTGCKYNNRNWSVNALLAFFGLGDLDRLRAVGEPLPGPGPFTVYRGVSGERPYRKIKGLSWTLCRDVACNFALGVRKADPAVYVGRMRAENVLCFWNGRGEQELIGPVTFCKRLIMSMEEMEAAATRLRASQCNEVFEPTDRLNAAKGGVVIPA